MGCDESKDQLPTLLCFYENGNDIQKEYCLRLKDNFRHEKPIRYDIKSTPGVNFSIQFRVKDKTHKIQTVFNEGELENCLNIMYKILDDTK